MKINNNIQALNSYRNLYQNQMNTSKNLEKLSSGLRINRAADDAAGLAISEKMRSQIRGLKMAERNALDGISLLQTAEGAMQEVHSMLQRMRELAVQAANDTNTDQDRNEIQKEINQLQTEIDSVAEKTEFNTRKLLNGSSAVLSVINHNNANLVGLPEIVDPNVKSGDYAVDVQLADPDNEDSYIKYNITQPAAGLTSEEDIKFDFDTSNQQLGEYTIHVRNFNPDNANSNNTGATIEVIGPNGLSIDERAVAVGQTLEGTDAQYQTIGGLQIDVSKIDKAGTVKVTMEAEATFTVSTDRNMEAPKYREAVVEGNQINVPTINQDNNDTTVNDIMNDNLGLPGVGENGGLPADNELVAVLKGMPISSDPTLEGNNLSNNAFSADSIDNFLSDFETAVENEGIALPADVDNIDAAVNAACNAAKTAALSGNHPNDIKTAANDAALASLKTSYPDVDEGELNTLAEAIVETTWDEDGENVNLINRMEEVVKEASIQQGAEDTLGATYFSVRNENGDQLLYRAAEADLGDQKVAVNKSTGVISINSDPNLEVTTDDVRNALISSGYSGVQAWSVASGDTNVERDMLAVTNNSDSSSPVNRNPHVISTADYQPVAFRKTMTTVNGKLEHGGIEFNFDSSIQQGKTEFSVINNALSFQIGPNTSQNVFIDVAELNTVRLGIDDISVTSQTNANDAIFALDEAIQQVSSIRSKLGATQNRMEHTINNLQVTHENLTAAESRIRDADMALEMTEFTRNNILNQSATAMLAQANQLPQGVLQLLQ